MPKPHNRTARTPPAASPLRREQEARRPTRRQQRNAEQRIARETIEREQRTAREWQAYMAPLFVGALTCVAIMLIAAAVKGPKGTVLMGLAAIPVCLLAYHAIRKGSAAAVGSYPAAYRAARGPVKRTVLMLGSAAFCALMVIGGLVRLYP
jgi:uncharacterized membrane protein